MTTGKIRVAIVAERVAWIRNMVAGIQSLPLASLDAFLADRRTPAAAESYLRRALEALLDLGRHVLAKGFAIAAAEYKDVGEKLADVGVFDESHRWIMRQMAGYRNRMVHFYQEVTHEELYDICTSRIHEIEQVCDAILCWIREHPDRIDSAL